MIMRLLIVISISCIVLGAVVAVAARVDPPICEYTLHTHIVQPGDTLWEIAKSYSPRGRDLRAVVYNIKIANSLESAIIYPGQVLTVPVEGKK